MDKFVTRESTWRIKKYDTDKAKTTTVAGLTKPKSNKPLTQLVKNQVSLRKAKETNIGNSPSGKTPPHSDSGISNTSSNEPSELCQENIENMPPNTSDCIEYSCKINDYVNEQASEQEEVAFQTLVVSEAPSVNTKEFDKMLQRDLKPKASHNATSKKAAHSTPTHSHNQLARINRDIRSPSASVRLRAIKALNCPVESHYHLFDVSHTEENIITDEERNRPRPPTLEELMKCIKVYVEVRSGEDNRSMGIRQVIAAMGAHVNNKLLRDTTHVVFKDGLLSTYRKAKKWNIPIVSILWIEACRLQQRICHPKDFPISNIDRYENPEYYEKMKRVKSMQPDSECNIRVRVKPSTPKDANQKSHLATNLSKRLGTAGSAIRTPSALNTPKTGSENSEENTNSKTASKVIPKINNVFVQLADSENNIDSPATRFLKKVESNTMTPLANTKSKQTQFQVQAEVPFIPSNNEKNRNIVTSLQKISTRRTLMYASESTDNQSRSSKSSDSRINLQRRATMNVTKHSCEDMSLDKTLQQYDDESSEQEQVAAAAAAAYKDMSCMTNNSSLQRRQSTRRKTILAKVPSSPSKEKKITSPNNKRGQRRRTTYTEKTIEIDETPKNSRSLERTIYTPQNMEVESHAFGITTSITDEQRIDNLCESLSTTRIPEQPLASSTMHVFSDEPKDNLSTGIAFDSTRKPGRRRSLFDVSMDIISERLQNINRSARRSTINNAVLPTIVDEPEEAQAPQESQDSETSDEKYTDAHTHAFTPTPTPTPVTSETLIKKKRKLFAPNNNDSLLLLGTPPPILLPMALKKTKSSPSPRVQKKRRRTLMPLYQPCTSSNSNTLHTAYGDDDDDPSTIPATAPAVIKSNEPETEKHSQRRSTMDFDISDKKSEKIPKVPKPRPIKYLVATNMHKTQKDVIAKALKKLGVFGMENIVSERTTHVVTLEPRRTINLLRGLTRGLWILEYAWITDSIVAGFWQEEEAYELKDFSKAIKICRSERQAFGSAYSCELFATLGAFYISASCGNVNRNMMVEFIKLGGGQLVDQRQKAKYIICTVQHCIEDKIHITPKWILDSITQMQLQAHSKYQPIYKGPSVGKAVTHPSTIEKISHRYLLKHQRP